MSVLGRLASVAARSGTRVVARPRSRFERPIDDESLAELEVERVWSLPRRRAVAAAASAVPAPAAAAAGEPPPPRRPLPGDSMVAADGRPSPVEVTRVVGAPDVRRQPATAAAPVSASAAPGAAAAQPILVLVAPEPEPPPTASTTAAIPGDAPPTPPTRAERIVERQVELIAPPAGRDVITVTPADARPAPNAITSAPGPPAPTRTEPALAPTDRTPVTVTIGRLELRNVAPPPPRPRPPATPHAPLHFCGPTLDEFLGGDVG